MAWFGEQGGTATIAVEVRDPADVLTDPDAGTLQLVIKDAAAATVLTRTQAQLTRTGQGQFHYDWTIPGGQALGAYQAEWTAALTGVALEIHEDGQVVPSGSLAVPGLTVAELRAKVRTSLSDEALQLIIDANDGAITERLGPSGTQDQWFFPLNTSTIWLRSEPLTIVSITEHVTADATSTVLTTDDYLVHGQTLRRVYNANTYRDLWGDSVQVVYTTADDTKRRKLILQQLCENDLNFRPGIAQYTTGAHSESAGDWSLTRQAILTSMMNPHELRIG